jgi:CRP/FNR family cyclic AMP-dependent transcriptional regulator
MKTDFDISCPSVPTVEAIISKHPFSKGMSPHQIRLLSDCAMQVHFRANERIFSEGDPANRFYLIQTGRVGIESFVAGKGKVNIQGLEAGDVLGWSWMFPPYFWHFDARALEPTDALFLYGTPLREECESDHELGYELMKRTGELMLGRLQATRKTLLNLPVDPLVSSAQYFKR